jgi:class 3 adenylate cyclase
MAPVDQRDGYTSVDGGYVAYSIVGEGPPWVWYGLTTMTSFEATDEEPHFARFLRRLAGFCGVVRIDPRGMGLSDPIDASHPPTVGSLVNDVLRVMDDVEAREFAVIGEGTSGLVAVEAAWRAPERVTGLVLINAYARAFSSDDYPIGYSKEWIEAFAANSDPQGTWTWKFDDVETDDCAVIAPSLAHDARFRQWWIRGSRRSASPSVAGLYSDLYSYADVRARLPEISARTLVAHRRDNLWMPVEHGRYLAEHIAGARYVELEGADSLAWSRPGDDLLEEIEEFLTGRRSGNAERVLASVLFTDIVDSTAQASGLGDAAWRSLLDAHDALVRSELNRFGGREVNTTGDGFVSAFDSPTQAVRCAEAIVAAAATLGLALRAGVHTGECERRGNDLAGLTVHIAARVAATADSGRVLVSRTVRDLVSGSELRFADRGEHALKGVPEQWQLFELMSEILGRPPSAF